MDTHPQGIQVSFIVALVIDNTMVLAMISVFTFYNLFMIIDDISFEPDKHSQSLRC